MKRKKEIANKLVLVVPFNPILYNNEASKEMIEQSQYKYKQVQNIMRLGLDKALHKVIADSSLSKSMLESYTTQSDWDELEYIYANCDYFFDQAMSWEPGKKTLFGKSKLSSDKDIDDPKKSKKKEKKQKEEAKYDGELRSDIKNNPDKFLNVKFREKDFLKNYAKKNRIDFFLFINQFDIKGDYSDPYKVGSYSYNREIKVHYSVFNHDGKYLYGSYATSEFPATENDPVKVTEVYFMKLVKEIVKNIPY